MTRLSLFCFSSSTSTVEGTGAAVAGENYGLTNGAAVAFGTRSEPRGEHDEVPLLPMTARSRCSWGQSGLTSAQPSGVASAEEQVAGRVRCLMGRQLSGEQQRAARSTGVARGIPTSAYNAATRPSGWASAAAEAWIRGEHPSSRAERICSRAARAPDVGWSAYSQAT